jgi:hypothetical protein
MKVINSQTIASKKFNMTAVKKQKFKTLNEKEKKKKSFLISYHTAFTAATFEGIYQMI